LLVVRLDGLSQEMVGLERLAERDQGLSPELPPTSHRCRARWAISRRSWWRWWAMARQRSASTEPRFFRPGFSWGKDWQVVPLTTRALG
jgi:hypothetical protein